MMLFSRSDSLRMMSIRPDCDRTGGVFDSRTWIAPRIAPKRIAYLVSKPGGDASDGGKAVLSPDAFLHRADLGQILERNDQPSPRYFPKTEAKR